MRPVRSSTASTRPSRCVGILEIGGEPKRLAAGFLDQRDSLADGAGQCRGGPRRGWTATARVDARGHRHGRALGGQPLGDGPADPPAAARHQSRFPGEQLRHRSVKCSSIGARC